MKTKCNLCKRKKFDERDIDYIKNTGNCFRCEFEIHKEDMLREHLKKIQTKHPTDLSKHEHIYQNEN
jgi:hypothetical protein